MSQPTFYLPGDAVPSPLPARSVVFGVPGAAGSVVTPPVQTLYSTNMSEQTVGSAALNWSNLFGPSESGTPVVLSVVASTNPTGSGKALRGTSGPLARRRLIQYIPAGQSVDAEILMLWKSFGTSNGAMRPGLRANFNASLETCVVAGNRDMSVAADPGDMQINTYQDGTLATLANTLDAPLSETWYYTRSRVVGQNVSAKTWPQGSAEPAPWGVTGTMPAGIVTIAGMTGLWTNAGSAVTDIGYFAVTTDTTTAIPVPVL